MKKCDVLIVGGGIAGASLGCLLATQTRLDVVILEASDRLGGRARTAEFGGGEIDYGLHALLLGRRSSLFDLGREVTRGLSSRPMGASIHRDGKLQKLLGDSMLSLPFSRKIGLSSLLLSGTRTLLHGNPDRLYRVSLDAFCDRYGVEGEARDFLRCLAIGLFVNARFDQISAGEIFSYLLYSARRMGLVGYPAGGWKTIWKRFGQILGAEQGRLRLEEGLVEMKIKGGRVTQCLTDREPYVPDRVVLAIPPATIEKQHIIPPDAMDPETYRQLAACKMTFGCNVDLVIENMNLPNEMIFTVDPPTLAFSPTAVTPGILCEGRHLMTLFTPLGTNLEGISDGRKTADSLITLYDRVIPGMKAHITERLDAVLPITGAEVTVESNYLDRPPIHCPAITNLFLIGDWVRAPGVGGEKAFASAIACYRKLCREKAGL